MAQYKIAVDCLGFENSPAHAISAAVKFFKKHKNVKFILVTRKIDIQKKILKNKHNFKFIYTDDEVLQTDTVLQARRKSNSSMLICMDLLNNNIVDAVVSAGSSSVLTSLAYVKIGVFPKLSKPAFIPYIPTENYKGFNIIDVGSNINQTVDDLVDLAKIGYIYAKFVRGIENPKIGLLNIATEDTKGPVNIQETNLILKKVLDSNYVGMVEPRELLLGNIDILVADGFSGNLVLKTLEGSLKTVGKILKKSIKFNPIGGLFNLNFILKIIKTFDYKNNAGAVVIGLKKLIVKTHGSADKKQFYSALRLAYDSLEANLINKLSENFS